MYLNIGSKSFGTHLAVVAVGSIAFLLASSTSAETLAAINGTSIDSTVYDLYLESRIQKPAAQATAEERDLILKELTDIYLLTTQPRAEVMAKDTRVKAQAELQYRGVLAQAVAADYLENNQATEDEIFTTYMAQIELSPPLQFKARHILVESQGEATELIKQLDGGAEFETLAKSESTGPSGPAGGDLGWFAPNQMVKPFADAVAALEDGAYTKAPVQTDFGWHVILREESRSNEPPTLDSARDIIKQNVEQARFQEYLEQLRQAQSDAG